MWGKLKDQMGSVTDTVEILAYKALNRDIDNVFVAWAVEMLSAGYETENLVILAGESAPFNQFQMQALVDKVLLELHLDYTNTIQTIKNYACHLIDKSLNEEIRNFTVLKILKDICIELDYQKDLYNFYLLYFARSDLYYQESQWYWAGATRENIDQVITDYFIRWQSNEQKQTSS